MTAMRDVFWNCVYETMKQDQTIFVLTADFGAPSLDKISSAFPDQFLSVGIAEQNLINVAAGLALEGHRVFAYAIAPFFLRATEQIRINLVMTSQFRPLNVSFIGVGAGFSYEVSGPSHHALEDLAILRNFPELDILTPSDANSTKACFPLTEHSGIRYLRFDSRPQPDLYANDFSLPECGYTIPFDPPCCEAALVTCGACTHMALELGKRIHSLKVIDLIRPSVKISEALYDCRKIFTLEEGVTGCGGIDALIRMACPGIPVISFGVSKCYEFHAKKREALKLFYGMDIAQIEKIIQEEIHK